MELLDEIPHWALKLIATIILFILSMIFGAIPLKLSRDENAVGTPLRNLLISLSNCFAGGVFFSTVVLDLFPLVKTTMGEALATVNIETKFPLGDFIIGFGFIMMLIIEQFVHTCFGNTFLSHPGHSHNVDMSDNDENVFSTAETAPLLTGDDIHEEPLNVDETTTDGRVSAKKHVSLGDTWVLHGNLISYSDEDEEIENTLEQSQRSQHSIQSYDTFYSQHGTHHRVRKMYRTKSLASMQSVTHSNFRTYVLVFAISLHSLFEGLSVGLTVNMETLIQLLIGLLIHKSIIAFSIGVQLVDADLKSLAVLICLVIFASMAPIGIGLGVIVLDYSNDVVKKFSSGVLQGIATGSFLYVTFFEVLPHELNIQDEKKPLKILFVLIGYSLTTAICYYEHDFKNVYPTAAPPT